MWRVLTVVCAWVFVCLVSGAMFFLVVMFSVCTCFSCVRVCVCQCRCVRRHPQSHTPNSSSSISTNTHTRSPPHQHVMACHVISCHVTCSAGPTHTDTPHNTTEHLIGRSVCEGFLSCLWKSLFLFHCLCPLYRGVLHPGVPVMWHGPHYRDLSPTAGSCKGRSPKVTSYLG